MYIPIEYFANRGVQEEEAKYFQTSFFYDVYRQAFDAIASVVRNSKVQKFEDVSVYDVQNTIAFIGRRGTGKTSAMISVFQALKSKEKLDLKFGDSKMQDTLETINHTGFVALPRIIDASHLEEKEDLFEVILATMLGEIIRITNERDFKEKEYGDRIASLQNDIATMQNNYDSLLESRDRSISATYHQLRQSAEKHNIQKSFYEIVKQYLKIVTDVKKDKDTKTYDHQYLVICIDDIDMYAGDPMQIMQCIYRYFTLPNLIVLTSMNYDMLYQYIFRHYSEHTNTPICGHIISNSDNKPGYSKRERLCHEQCNDYLRKIIPHDMRIIMPSWKKSDYRDICTKNVRLLNGSDFSDKDKGMQALFPRLYPGRVYYYLEKLSEEKEPEISVKRLLFQMLADRLGIYLNPNGYKQHFMEPDGLRSTFELFDSLYLMQNIRINEDENTNKYTDSENHDKIRENYKIMLDTFYFKMLPNLMLNDEEAELFSIFSKATPSRRGKIIIDNYKKRSADAAYKQSNNTKGNENQERDDYCIGELFRIIHHASRKDIFSKELVKAILASYSFILPYYSDEGIFEYYKKMDDYSQNTEDKEKPMPFASDKIQTLFGIFGGSLLGNWVNEMFGGKSLRVRLDTEALKKRKNYKDKLLPLLTVMMFTRIDHLLEQNNMKFIRSKTIENQYILDCDLDPSAFMINIIRIHEFVDKLREIILHSKTTDQYFKPRAQNLIKNVLRDFEDTFKEFSGPYDSYDELKIRYPLFPFPIHQVDLAYSVIKRAVRDIVYISDNELTSKSKPAQEEEIIKTMVSFYQKIFKELIEVQACYPILDKNKKNHSIFAEKYASAGALLGIWSFTNPKESGEPDSPSRDVVLSDVQFKDKSDQYYLKTKGIEWIIYPENTERNANEDNYQTTENENFNKRNGNTSQTLDQSKPANTPIELNEILKMILFPKS